MGQSLDLQQGISAPDEPAEPLLAFLARGFVFPCWSGAYYRAAARRGWATAVLFLVIFASVTALIGSLQAAIPMWRAEAMIKQAYERGEVPAITIEDGIARTDGNQQVVYEQDGVLLALDTTGEMTRIDDKYRQAVLVTRDTLFVVNQDNRLREMPLSDLNRMFGNPIVLDQTSVTNIWRGISLVVLLFSFFGALLWDTGVRLFYLLVLALGMWGAASLLRKGVTYESVVVSGVFATVPVVYLSSVLGRFQLTFLGLFTLLLLPVWGLALWAVTQRPGAVPGAGQQGVV